MKAALIVLDKIADCIVFISRKWMTISARVGYASYRGKTWGRVCERLIDGAFGKGHCRRTAIAEGLIH